MNYNLIFDLGYHNGKSTINYLKDGYTIVAVECNPDLITRVKCIFESYIKDKQLILVEKAISDKDHNVIDFFICNYFSEWSSCNYKIPYRESNDVTKIIVSTITLSSLIQEYGCPYYCKIDIEGYDAIAIKSLSGLPEIPKYISAESECIGDEDHDSIDFLEVLNSMRDVGYTKFAIVHGSNDEVIDFTRLEYTNYENAAITLALLRKNFTFEKEWCFWFDIVATY